MLTAVAALDYHEATPAFSFEDKGCLVFGGQPFCNAGRSPRHREHAPGHHRLERPVLLQLGFLFWKTFDKGDAKDVKTGYGIQTTAKAFGLGGPPASACPRRRPGGSPTDVQEVGQPDQPRSFLARMAARRRGETRHRPGRRARHPLADGGCLRGVRQRRHPVLATLASRILTPAARPRSGTCPPRTKAKVASARRCGPS